MAVRMNLGMAVTQSHEEVRKDFLEALDLYIAQDYTPKGKKLTVQEYYVFVSCSVAKHKGIKRFKVEELDKAVTLWMKKAKVKSKRLFVGLGAEYLVDGVHEGAVDLVITGTDY